MVAERSAIRFLCQQHVLVHGPGDDFGGITCASHPCAMLQGALDGGLDIPHSEKRFVGYSTDDKSLDAETLRKYIYGGHVAEYMEEMQEEAPEKYQVCPLAHAVCV